ncbi:hypothetical protein ACJX0J_008375, partial [Zea mays]
MTPPETQLRKIQDSRGILIGQIKVEANIKFLVYFPLNGQQVSRLILATAGEPQNLGSVFALLQSIQVMPIKIVNPKHICLLQPRVASSLLFELGKITETEASFQKRVMMLSLLATSLCSKFVLFLNEQSMSGDCCLISVEPTRMFFPYFFSIITLLGTHYFLAGANAYLTGHIKLITVNHITILRQLFLFFPAIIWEMKQTVSSYVTTAIRFMFCNYTYNMLLVALWGAGGSDLSSKAKNYCAIRFMFCNYTYNMAQIYHLKQRITEVKRNGKISHWSNLSVTTTYPRSVMHFFFANYLDRYGNVFYGHGPGRGWKRTALTAPE